MIDQQQANQLLLVGWLLMLIALVIYARRNADQTGEYLTRYGKRYSPDVPLGLSVADFRARYGGRPDLLLAEAPRMLWRTLRAYTPQQDPELEALRRVSGPSPFRIIGLWIILSLVLLPLIVIAVSRV
jgi:hypothetical protein